MRDGGADKVIQNLNQWSERKQAATMGLLESWAARLAGTMKKEAPWTDRTSHARNGLSAKAVREDQGLTIHLFHTMEYGKWLELVRDGQNAILVPTRDKAASQVKASIERLWK